MKALKVLFLIAITAIPAASSIAQNYSIDWYTIAGGGGTSSGGIYSLSGTIGQPAAGVMTGGSYALIGGFWGIISPIQIPGSPLLTVAFTKTNTVTVSWPSPSTGFVLQQNNDLSTQNWLPASQAPLDNGTTKTIVVNPPLGNLYFRLQK